MIEKYHAAPSKKELVVAFSISYEKETLLARGFGVEHLREMLLRLARPILRNSASLAYGGHLFETPDNFTIDLLNLINSEQLERSVGEADEDSPNGKRSVGRLYNHQSWPYFLSVTPEIEARWINCCRIIRCTQEMAGLHPDTWISDADAKTMAESRAYSPRAQFNRAVCLSVMRNALMKSHSVTIEGLQHEEVVPAVQARVLLGGKTDSYTGFVPGIFEEALATIEARRPVYILGGFGGAGEALARAIFGSSPHRPEFELAWHLEHTTGYKELLESTAEFELPHGVRTPEATFEELRKWVEKARENPANVLCTGLDNQETRELSSTQDMDQVVRLVRKGLTKRLEMVVLPQ